MPKKFHSATSPILFCCAIMEDFVKDDRLYIDYDPIDQGFFTPLVWPDHCVKQFFTYCPWCATKVLPKEFEEE